jgi:hypothetical protein
MPWLRTARQVGEDLVVIAAGHQTRPRQMRNGAASALFR